MLPVFSVLGTRLIAAADEGGTARRRNSRFATLQADSELRKRQRSGPNWLSTNPWRELDKTDDFELIWPRRRCGDRGVVGRPEQS
jgi:hypothetical protein